MPDLIDSHCHLDARDLQPRLPAVARQARISGVRGVITAGVCPQSWPEQFQAGARFADSGVRVWHVLGTHPWWVEYQTCEQVVEALEQALHSYADSVIGVGEIGLDFARNDLDVAQQNALFTAQLAVANRFGLPVVLHERQSADRLLYWLRRKPHWGGVVHGFSGSIQQAWQFIDQGFYLGVGNAVTHPRATRLQRMLKALPVTSLLLETDAPNQPGYRHRGAMSRPAHLRENLNALAALRGCSEQELAAQLLENTQALFAIEPTGCLS